MSADATAAIPLIDMGGGDPVLVGSRCRACAAVMVEPALACPACLARDTLEPYRLAGRGTVHSFTVVHRSYPGVPTPFTAVVVDLDGGGTVKGTLVGSAHDPARLGEGLRVAVTYRPTGQSDLKGRPFLSYYFEPVEEPDA